MIDMSAKGTDSTANHRKGARVLTTRLSSKIATGSQESAHTRKHPGTNAARRMRDEEDITLSLSDTQATPTPFHTSLAELPYHNKGMSPHCSTA